MTVAPRLRRFRVYGRVVGGKYLGEFEAVDENAAIEAALASEAGQVYLCHQCSNECEDAQVDEAYADEVKE